MTTDPNRPADHPQRQSEPRAVASAQETETDDALRWIENRGGSTTVRELQRGLHRRYPTARTAEEVLVRLEEARLGDWEHVPPGPRGGRRTKRFCLRSDPPYPSDDTGEVVSPVAAERCRHTPARQAQETDSPAAAIVATQEPADREPESGLDGGGKRETVQESTPPPRPHLQPDGEKDGTAVAGRQNPESEEAHVPMRTVRTKPRRRYLREVATAADFARLYDLAARRHPHA